MLMPLERFADFPGMSGQPVRPDVPWRDLARLTAGQAAWELIRPLPWLLASWYLVDAGCYLAALVFSLFFFLAGLRLAHDAFHYNLSLPRRVTEFVIAATGAVMLGSMHAVQVNHLRHHAHCLRDEDVEGASGKMSAWQAIRHGPRFTFELHRHGWRFGSRRQRQWMAVELAWTAMAVGLAVGGPRWFGFHAMAMVGAHCLTSFFAVWTVHHDCVDTPFQARTLRSRWKSLVSHEMFFHVEHHLFPGVPTRRLARLAARLDAVSPDAARLRVW